MTTPLESYVASASEYVALIESFPRCSPSRLLAECRHLLPRLYLHALNLPEGEPSGPECDLHEVPVPQWVEFSKRLHARLGDQAAYRIIYNPLLGNHDEPLIASLADDLADIWYDLKRQLLAWDSAPTAARDSLRWHMAFAFHSHWSYHAADAIRVLTWLKEGR